MADLAKLVVKLEAESSKLRAELEKSTARLQRFERKTDTMATKVKGAFKSIGVAAAGLVSVAAINNAIDAYGRQEQAIFQLEARLKSTAGAAGKTSAELQKTAASLQKVTTFGDEAIIEMQSLLLTFTQIKGANFDQATQSILDVATAMKTDLKTAAIQVGKALNDPVAGIGALSRSGIQFSEDQKEMIKSLVETGKTAEAQQVILAELRTQFGGAAEAAAKGTGKMQQLKNSLGDIGEVIGGAIVKSAAFGDTLNFLRETADVLAGNTSLRDWAATAADPMVFLAKISKQVQIAFSNIGKTLGAVAAGFTAFFKFDFDGVGTIFDSWNQDIAANMKELESFYAEINAGPSQVSASPAAAPQSPSAPAGPVASALDFPGVEAALEKINGSVVSIDEAAGQVDMPFADKASVALDSVQQKVAELDLSTRKIAVEFDEEGAERGLLSLLNRLQAVIDRNRLRASVDIVQGISQAALASGSR